MNKNITLTIAGETVNVTQSVSTSDKVDFVDAVLSKSISNGYYNPILVDAYFHLNLVYLFSDIVFSEEDREDELKLYDDLKENGILKQILDNIPKEVYEELLCATEETIAKSESFYKSATYNLSQIISTVPMMVNQLIDEMNKFDLDKYVNVKKFAEALNGGRDIKTNAPVKQG